MASAVDYGLTEQEYKQAQEMAKLKQIQSGGNFTAAPGSYQRALAAEIEAIRRNKGQGAATVGTQSGTESSSFSGIADPEVYAQLKNKLSGMLSGTDANTARAAQLKEQSINQYDQLLADFSKKGAFTDAAALMQQNLNSAMEANKPAIQRAIEGSGTSAGSMQALLSQQLADKASLSAGALGAEQAKAYGQISASLMSGRGQLTTGRDAGISDIAMIGDLLKTSRSNSNSFSNFDPLRQELAAGGNGGGSVSWSTYGPDPKNQWMTKPGTLEDKFRTGVANPLDPSNNFLYGSNGTY
jgi:hypothetical protein